MSENRSVVSNSGNPMDSTIHGILQVKILEKVAFPFLGDLPNSGIEHRSPALQGDSLPSEPQGKPKNTGVDIVQLSRSQSCPTLCDPMDCSTRGFPVHHQLPELAQIHVH